MTERKTIDWERIEADYRAGILSLREIAAAHPGVSHMAISRHAKKKGWKQDLSARIHAKAEEIVARESVTKSVTPEQLVTDQLIVDQNAADIANVRLSHRRTAARFQKLALSLLAELEVTTDNAELFAELGEMLRSEDDKGVDRRNDVYNRVIGSAGRVDTTKKLAETLKILIGLEREAYGLSNDTEKEKAIDNLANALEAARKRVA